MSKQNNLFELLKRFGNHKITNQTITNEKGGFIVFSHYVGSKEINTILTQLAIKTAYSELAN